MPPCIRSAYAREAQVIAESVRVSNVSCRCHRYEPNPQAEFRRDFLELDVVGR
jgi:hypothetical protein